MASQETRREAYSGRRLSQHQHQPPRRPLGPGSVGYSNEMDTSAIDETTGREIVSSQPESSRRRASYAERTDEFLFPGHMRSVQQVELPRQYEEIQEDQKRAIASVKYELDSAQHDLKQALEDGERWRKEAEDSNRRWKKAAGELNNLRASSQGFYQVTDAYLVDLIMYLRHNIGDFSIQYFDGYDLVTESELIPDENYAVYMESATTHSFEYLTVSETRPKLVQAFMWRVLCSEIFGRFHWLGKEQSEAVQVLGRNASPNFQPEHDQQTYRKFQIWRATTVELLLANLDPQQSADHVSMVIDCAIKNIEATISPFAKSNGQKGFRDQLQDILDSALNLDKEMCKQVARLEWNFPAPSTEFESGTMEIEPGGELLSMNDGVQLVIAPGVVKRGKSTGERFDVEEQLIKTMVACS